MDGTDGLDDPFDDLTAEQRAAVQAASDEFYATIGYEPLPHDIQIAPDDQTVAPTAEVGRLEATRARERVAAILGELVALEPGQLEFDPFLGELRDTERPDTAAILAVVRAEAFVAEVARTASRARQTVSGLAAELAPARAVTEQRLAPLRAQRRLVVENLAHATERLAAVADAEDPTTPEFALRVRYSGDARVTQGQLDLIDVRTTVGALEDGVVSLGVTLGDAAVRLQDGFARSSAHRRRRSRTWRAVRRVLFAVFFAGVGLVVGEVVGAVWAFAGSAVLAGLTMIVDPVVAAWLDGRARTQQVAALGRAVGVAGTLLDVLLQTEAHVNTLRRLHALVDVTLVPRSLLLGSGGAAARSGHASP